MAVRDTCSQLFAEVPVDFSNWSLEWDSWTPWTACPICGTGNQVRLQLCQSAGQNNLLCDKILSKDNIGLPICE